MRMSRRWGKRLAIGLALTAALGVAGWTWLVPALLVRSLQARTGGNVEFRGWWINGRSAGLVGLTLHEGLDARSPVWASAAKVATDLSLGALLRGRVTPGRVRLIAPEIVLRLSAQGELLTPVQWRSAESATPMPVIIAERARVTLRQEGRPAMSVEGVIARLGPAEGNLLLSAQSNDPEWGPAEAHGQFAHDFSTGSVVLETMRGIAVDPAKARRIPFVTDNVWAHVEPQGMVDVRVAVDLGNAQGRRLHVRTEIDFQGTRVTSRTLDLTAEGTTGRVSVDGGLVTFKDVFGRAIDGQVTANGTLDFRRSPAESDLHLDLDGIDVTKTPPSWQLQDAGVTGRLTGKVQLIAKMGANHVDFSGTTGDAVVEKGTIQGIPFKRLRLSMKARGKSLQYASDRPASSSSSEPLRRGLGALVVAIQPPAAPEAVADAPRIKLPESLTTHIELEDVHLDRLIARVDALLGYPIPVPITGRLALKAEARIPLGKLKSLRDYAFHGDLTLTRASIYGIDLGHVAARIDLEKSVLELSDVRGALVDRPDGGPDNPPEDTGDVPRAGPLPPGGFRGSLRAELSATGRLSTRFTGVRLPLGELAAPALPRPTPVSGEVSFTVDGFAPFKFARDPAAWTATARIDSRAIHYTSARLDGVTARLALNDGRFTVAELSATLRDQPLKLRGSIDLKPPRAFRGSVDVTAWDLAEVLAWSPPARSLPIDGLLTGRASAEGTLTPSTLKTEGKGTVEALAVKTGVVGDVPFDWTMKGETILVNVSGARVFGGGLTAHATLPPKRSGEPMTGSATLTSVDLAPIVALIPGEPIAVSGKASGRIAVKAPANATALEANIDLTAPDLLVRGVAASGVKAVVAADAAGVNYELTADSLGGKVKFKGSYPRAEGSRASRAPRALNGELIAVGFMLDQVWKAFGQTGAITAVSGRGALNANLRAELSRGFAARGVVEFRDLRWRPAMPIGGLSGVVALSPEGWRLDSLRGKVLGGAISGHARGDLGPGRPDQPERTPLAFLILIDRVSLKDLLVRAPTYAAVTEGFGAFRLAGALGDEFQASGDFQVDSAQFARMPVSEIRVPIELVSNGGEPTGMAHLRRWSARLAGGQLRGDAWFRLGADRAFSSTVDLTGIDIEPFTRLETQAIRPASGKVSGRLTLLGTDPDQPRTYRGRVTLNLDDASLVAIPVFREIDRFLGAARGGLFEDGDLTGVIANQQLHVERLTLRGRVAQLHVSGMIGFDGQVNLEVVVNTNQIITETGEALIGAITGLRGALGRNSRARGQVANYLSTRLLKLRVTGTLRNPTVALDPGIALADNALSFFVGVLQLPLGLLR